MRRRYLCFLGLLKEIDKTYVIHCSLKYDNAPFSEIQKYFLRFYSTKNSSGFCTLLIP